MSRLHVWSVGRPAIFGDSIFYPFTANGHPNKWCKDVFCLATRPAQTRDFGFLIPVLENLQDLCKLIAGLRILFLGKTVLPEDLGIVHVGDERLIVRYEVWRAFEAAVAFAVVAEAVNPVKVGPLILQGT